ncbi:MULTISPECIES: HNH endonuclease [Bacillus cereus group]|uniref:HNH endonuclease n=1 Tax=Bacillus cereus group TaxID=86661 RepID=UPI0037C1B19D
MSSERLQLLTNSYYSEAHHIKPLGSPHNGRDIRENIIVLCPNHHALCDYGAIPLNQDILKNVKGHELSQEFIDYHNSEIFNKINK